MPPTTSAIFVVGLGVNIRIWLEDICAGSWVPVARSRRRRAGEIEKRRVTARGLLV